MPQLLQREVEGPGQGRCNTRAPNPTDETSDKSRFPRAKAFLACEHTRRGGRLTSLVTETRSTAFGRRANHPDIADVPVPRGSVDKKTHTTATGRQITVENPHIQ